MMDFKHSCPCCGQYEFPEEGSFEIFPAAAGRIILFKQGTLTTEAGLTL
ncbi:hypothetical protein electrica_02951 [Klebsiella electrica]|nr:hypothetical protein electrica_02951 [Klebsiella electrica]